MNDVLNANLVNDVLIFVSYSLRIEKGLMLGEKLALFRKNHLRLNPCVPQLKTLNTVKWGQQDSLNLLSSTFFAKVF